MKKVFLSLLAITIGLTTIVTVEAQTVDTSSYIKLYFKPSVDSISLDLSTSGQHRVPCSGDARW